jgi:hypothetical protein
MKIYISGKITGIEDEAKVLFENAEIYLKSKGYKVINPIKANHDHDNSWESYMKEDIKLLCDCDEIFMLKNWKESKGAILEHNLSEILKIKINYE